MNTMTSALQNTARRLDAINGNPDRDGIEYQLISAFGKLTKLVGYTEATRQFAKAGLIGNIEHDQLDVDEAQRIYECALMEVDPWIG